ncbi:hypothetical protein [Bacillus subtilis]|uniref:hypothetical protein n=1 Tax=Bacillus subtilis TaxID=1423 RepID=UPI002029D283|nr:hypothetical protein [Bacillus subtilis]
MVKGGTVATHINKGINKGKAYINSFIKSKNDLALVGIAQDINNTYSAKNTPLLKSIIGDKSVRLMKSYYRGTDKQEDTCFF